MLKLFQRPKVVHGSQSNPVLNRLPLKYLGIMSTLNLPETMEKECDDETADEQYEEAPEQKVHRIVALLVAVTAFRDNRRQFTVFRRPEARDKVRHSLKKDSQVSKKIETLSEIRVKPQICKLLAKKIQFIVMIPSGKSNIRGKEQQAKKLLSFMNERNNDL